jgi:MFS family permease
MSKTMKENQSKLFYGWIVVAIGLVTMDLASGFRYTHPVFFIPLQEEFGWTRTQINSIYTYSLATFVYVFSAPLAGALFDRYGPRKLFPVAALAIALMMVCCSQITELWHLYLFSLILIPMGAVSLGIVPHVALISNWFVKNRGLVIALGTSCLGIGGILVRTPLAQWFISNFGFRWAYALLGIGVFLVIAPLTALFQQRRPENMGLLTDGETPDLSGTGAASEPKLDMVVDRTWSETEWTIGRSLRTRRFWAFFSLEFFLAMGVYGVTVHLAPYAVGLGFSKMTAAAARAFYVGLGGPTKILWAFVGDRIGRELTYSFILFLASVAIVLLLLLRDPSLVWLLFASAILYSSSYGANMAILAPVAADLFQGKSLGAIYGFSQVASGVGRFLGPLFFGYLFDVTGGYTWAFLIALAALNISSALMWWVVAPRKVRLMG